MTVQRIKGKFGTRSADSGSSKYYPYGKCLKSQGNLGTDHLFTGQKLDSTGLYYYGARYYDPTIGRFISPDTFVQWSNGFDIVSSQLTVNSIPEGLGSVNAPRGNYPKVTLEVPVYLQTLDRYSYVLNSPLKYIDPSGWDTKGHGFNLNLGLGIGISIEVLRVNDDKGNKAWTLSLSFLGTTPVASAGYQNQSTTANTVNDLARWSGGGGASGGYGLASLGAEYAGYHRDEVGGWEGINIIAGVDFVPIPEVHAFVGYTWVLFASESEPQPQAPPGIDSNADYYYDDYYYDSYYDDWYDNYSSSDSWFDYTWDEICAADVAAGF